VEKNKETRGLHKELTNRIGHYDVRDMHEFGNSKYANDQKWRKVSHEKPQHRDYYEEVSDNG